MKNDCLWSMFPVIACCQWWYLTNLKFDIREKLQIEINEYTHKDKWEERRVI